MLRFRLGQDAINGRQHTQCPSRLTIGQRHSLRDNRDFQRLQGRLECVRDGSPSPHRTCPATSPAREPIGMHEPVVSIENHVCLYSSYFTQTRLPFFVRFYLEQLMPHFGRIVLLTNDDRALDQESVRWLAERHIELMPVKNEGYDFGMWQKALRRLGDLSACSRLCLANDSCICFAPLTDFFAWVGSSHAEAAGLVTSWEASKHLQSYLLVFSGRAIPVAREHILAMNMVDAAYDDIVGAGELGLSQALLAADIPLASRYAPDRTGSRNPSLLHCAALLDAGMPMIKRRMLNYLPRYLIKHAVTSGLGVSRQFYIARIQALHPGQQALMRQLFADLPPRNLGAEFKLWRQFLKHWLRLKLGQS